MLIIESKKVPAAENGGHQLLLWLYKICRICAVHAKTSGIWGYSDPEANGG